MYRTEQDGKAVSWLKKGFWKWETRISANGETFKMVKKASNNVEVKYHQWHESRIKIMLWPFQADSSQKWNFEVDI